MEKTLLLRRLKDFVATSENIGTKHCLQRCCEDALATSSLTKEKCLKYLKLQQTSTLANTLEDF